MNDVTSWLSGIPWQLHLIFDETGGVDKAVLSADLAASAVTYISEYIRR